MGEVTDYGPRSRKLLRLLKELRLPQETESFYRERLISSGLTSAELAYVDNVVNFLEHVTKWDRDVTEKARSVDQETRENLLKLRDDMKAIKRWLSVPRTRLSQQQVRVNVNLTRICAAEMAVRYAALSACRKVHVCHCNSLGGAT